MIKFLAPLIYEKFFSKSISIFFFLFWVNVHLLYIYNFTFVFIHYKYNLDCSLCFIDCYTTYIFFYIKLIKNYIKQLYMNPQRFPPVSTKNPIFFVWRSKLWVIFLPYYVGNIFFSICKKLYPSYHV